MNEQGEHPGKISTNYVNSKMIIAIVVAAVLGIAFVVTLIILGVQIAKNNQQNNPGAQPAQTPAVEEVIKVDYEEVEAEYYPGEHLSSDAANSLMAKYGISDKDYAVIRSSEELADFVDAVNSMGTDGGRTLVYKVDSDFFASGSVIAIAKESRGLECISVADIYRDAKYNIHISGEYDKDDESSETYGEVILIKIQNIQPKAVELNWTQSPSDDPDFPVVVKKPIVYIYPQKTMDVSVKLSNPERITVDYPDYGQGWKVTANPDGTLIDQSGKKLYSLYYESRNIHQHSISDLSDGFVLAKADVEDFLDQKLTALGLNYKEREEFISYWAGILESKPYVFIRFWTTEEIEQNMGLIVSPQPDTMIRVMMEYKPLNRSMAIREQKLPRAKRNGYTVVEWGGTELK